MVPCLIGVIVLSFANMYTYTQDSTQRTRTLLDIIQINAVVTDLMGEGHDAYHPVKRTGTYDSQKEAAAPMIKQFREERLPKYCSLYAHMKL